MDIYLECVDNKSGVIRDIGRYFSPVVPRIGEKISLRLTSRPGVTPYPGALRFKVVDVCYGANNTMQTEDWQIPYSHDNESIGVIVRVEPVTSGEGDSAQDYINRIAQKEQAE